MEELITPEQVADLIKMSPQFVRDHAEELGAVRMGGSAKRAGRLRFYPSRIHAFINNQGSPQRRPNEKAPRTESKRLLA